MDIHTYINIIQLSIGKWVNRRFTGCLNTCVYKAHKIQDIEVGTNKLHLELDISRSSSLNNIEDEDTNNYILSWTDTTDVDNYQ